MSKIMTAHQFKVEVKNLLMTECECEQSHRHAQDSGHEFYWACFHREQAALNQKRLKVEAVGEALGFSFEDIKEIRKDYLVQALITSSLERLDEIGFDLTKLIIPDTKSSTTRR